MALESLTIKAWNLWTASSCCCCLTKYWWLHKPKIINPFSFSVCVQEIPQWAQPDQVEKAMENQLEAINKKEIVIQKIFPPEQLLKQCQLAKIFKTKKRRFINRTSSALWSPMPQQ